MRLIKNLITGFVVFLTFCGCKKIITVSLKNTASQIVIVGEVNDQPGPYKVTISKTINYTSDNIFPAVSGALVIISGDGVTDTLSEITPGEYFSHNLKGTAGSSYTLYISAGGQTYTSTSVMPHPVPLDSIGFISGGRDNKILPVVYFQDPKGIANYYQFIEFVNGKKFSDGRGAAVFDDRLSDGRYISRLLYDDSSDIKSGAILKVQMNSIDKPVYDYFYQLLQISGGEGNGFASPSPANPASNISGGALGYFSANSTNSKSVLVP